MDAKTRFTLLNFGVDGARSLLTVPVGASLSYIVSAFSSLVVVIQIASAQLTPRVIARAIGDSAREVSEGPISCQIPELRSQFGFLHT
ncbi:MAG TPA: DUF2254 domain-containing protein [Deltaproteobacteria bacterium]|nr:DUF2254 domain-containing protein [Deltaproteobacteria bacterium]